MSLILDALKKLDREKASRRSRTAKIADEIIRPELPRPKKGILIYLPAISFTAVLAAGITYGVIAGFGVLSKSSPPPPVNLPAPGQHVALAPPESGSLPKPSPLPAKPPVASQQAAPAPMDPGSPPKSSPPAPVNPPAPSQPVGPAPLSRKPVRDAREETSQEPSKILNQAGSKSPAISSAEKKSRQKVVQEEEDVDSGNIKRPAEQTPKVSAAAPPSLKISGIVWHEEPAKRRAVINGTFTTEGSEIEGVKVVEIHPTRVRFLHNDRPFELSVFE